MEYSNIITIVRKDKEIVICLREGETLSLENIVDVEIYHPYFSKNPEEEILDKRSLRYFMEKMTQEEFNELINENGFKNDFKINMIERSKRLMNCSLKTLSEC